MNAAVFNFFILLTVGILVRYKFNPDGAIWGYGIMAVSLTGIVLQSTILKGLEENKESLGLVQSLRVLTKSIIGSQFPSFLLLISIMWLYTIYNKHKEIISQGKTPEQFDQFSSMSLTIISIQVLLLYLSLSDPAKTFGKLPLPPDVVKGFQSSLTATMSLVTVVNWFIIGIMYVIMEYFKTDG